MSNEDNNILYILDEDETQEEQDNSPLNFAAYDDADSSEEEVEANEAERKEKSAFSLLFYTMLRPVEGWKKIRRYHLKAETIQSGCFYPLLALLAISQFADYFYSVNVGLSQLVTKGIVVFVAYFFGYFAIQMVLSWVLPKDMAIKFEGGYGKQYLLISLSTLVLFSIFTSLLPMIWPILIFLPIWTLYIMFKGVRFFHFPQNQEMKFFVISGAAVIGIPLLIDWALNELMPY
ncbi:MAG: hypothetical protein J1F16_07110 [Muribaculaceae bacterium]|nr:hypothetical protein [Muribaculaceae bacterium]